MPRTRYVRAGSLAEYLHDNTPGSSPRVEIEKDDLLPRSKPHLPIDERYGEAGADQRGADVRVPVVVVPGFLVQVTSVLGSDLLKRALRS